MYELLTQQQLIEKLNEMEKRITAFSSVEQQLINIKDRLDQENVLYKRMQAFNTAAFREMTDEEFYRLVVESIIDVFEVETACILIGNSEKEFADIIICEGATHSVQKPEMLWHHLFSFCTKNAEGKTFVANASALFGFMPHAHFSQLMGVWYSKSNTKQVVKMIAGVSQKNAPHYNVFDAQKVNAFAVFSQQIYTHLLNRDKKASILKAQQKLSHIADTFLQFSPDPYQNIQFLINESCVLMGADFAFYHSYRQKNFLTTNHACCNKNLILLTEEMEEVSEVVREKTDISGHYSGLFFHSPANSNAVHHYTVLGRKVQLATTTYGEFCLCFAGEKTLTEEDIHLLGITASAIAVEKRRIIANTAQQESEQRYRIIFEGTPHGIVLLQANSGQIKYCNPAFEQMFGYRKLIHSSLSFNQIHQEALSAEMLLRLQSIRTNDFFILGKEVPCMKIGGGTFFADITAREIMIGTEKLIACFYVDVTERINAQKELTESNTALKKINSELDSFVYSVSHDLRAPLMAIKGLMTLFDFSVPNSEDNQEYWSMMIESVARMDETIREILDYSRNTRTGLTLETVDVEKIVQETFKDVQYAVTEPIAFQMHIDNSQPFVSDRVRMSTLIRNIISNAVKYRRTGATDNAVSVSFTYTNKKYAQLIIKDKGEGIAADKIDKVFEMFYRASSSAAGTGLGLYICKEIVQKLGGNIAISSEKNVGTTVTILLLNHQKNEKK